MKTEPADVKPPVKSDPDANCDASGGNDAKLTNNIKEEAPPCDCFKDKKCEFRKKGKKIQYTLYTIALQR